MIARFRLFILLLLFFRLLSWSDSAAGVRAARPRGIGIEVLGRSIVYGLQLDHALGDASRLTLGLARVHAQNDAETTLGSTGLVPIHYSHYFAAEDASIFWSAGLTWVTNPGNVQGSAAVLGNIRFSSSFFIPHLGVGYEIRQINGFLFRVEGLAMAGDSVAATTGFSLGYAF